MHIATNEIITFETDLQNDVEDKKRSVCDNIC